MKGYKKLSRQHEKVLVCRVDKRLYKQLRATVARENMNPNTPAHTTAGVVRCLMMDYLQLSSLSRAKLLRNWNRSNQRRYELFTGRRDKLNIDNETTP